MSPEEAARRAQRKATNETQPSRLNSSDITADRSRDRHNTHTTASDGVCEQRETEASNKEKEENKPEPRTLKTARSPSAERTGGLQGQILPVVDEAGEASSTGGRSQQSRDNDDSREKRPLTPPKDSDWRPVTPVKDTLPAASKENGKKTISRSSLDKDLPPLPPTMRVVENSV